MGGGKGISDVWLVGVYVQNRPRSILYFSDCVMDCDECFCSLYMLCTRGKTAVCVLSKWTKGNVSSTFTMYAVIRLAVYFFAMIRHGNGTGACHEGNVGFEKMGWQDEMQVIYM